MGGGVDQKRTGAYKGGGGVRNPDFFAYVLYGCPLNCMVLDPRVKYLEGLASATGYGAVDILWRADDRAGFRPMVANVRP